MNNVFDIEVDSGKWYLEKDPFVLIRKNSNSFNGAYESTLVRPSRPVKGERFGTATSLSSNTLAVGAPGNKGSSGRVYLFEKDETVGWMQTAVFSPPKGYFCKNMGYVVSISNDGNTIACGCYKEDRIGSDVVVYSTFLKNPLVFILEDREPYLAEKKTYSFDSVPLDLTFHIEYNNGFIDDILLV